MIDPTNIPAAIDNAGAIVAAGKSFWSQWGPTVAIAAAFLMHSLGRFNAWIVQVILFIESRGGFAQILIKMIWNPQVPFRRSKIIAKATLVGPITPGESAQTTDPS